MHLRRVHAGRVIPAINRRRRATLEVGNFGIASAAVAASTRNALQVSLWQAVRRAFISLTAVS